jgi:hypothetical protein
MRQRHASDAAQRPSISILVEQLSAIYCTWVRLKTFKQPTIPGVEFWVRWPIHLRAVLREHLSSDSIAENTAIAFHRIVVFEAAIELGRVRKPLELSYDVKRLTEK